MSKKKELSPAKNYMYYIGSASQRNYQESVEHIRSRSNYLDGKGYWDFYEFDQNKMQAVPKNQKK